MQTSVYRVTAVDRHADRVDMTILGGSDYQNRYVSYVHWLVSTRTNPQVGDVVEVDVSGTILGLWLGTY